jgi:hypothetical protein
MQRGSHSILTPTIARVVLSTPLYREGRSGIETNGLVLAHLAYGRQSQDLNPVWLYCTIFPSRKLVIRGRKSIASKISSLLVLTFQEQFNEGIRD